MTKSTTRKLTRAALLGSASLALMLSAAHAEQAVEFKIESGSLVTALNEYARQSDQEILFSSDIIAGKEAKAVNGVYEPQEALEMILADTGLVYAVDDGDTVLISDPTKETATPRTFRVAQVDQESDGSLETTPDPSDDDNPDVIVVTGSNIRGVNESPSPVYSFSKDEIDLTSQSTIAEVIETLPQTFGGAPRATTTAVPGTGNGANNNGERGSGINLRGLGADSTLTLLNGRRVAASGIGNFVDLSVIPLVAVERIEVLADGASAIYGSDAVGGVVNVILRDRFDGGQTRIRYGSAENSSSDEIQISHGQGFDWGSGGLLVGFEWLNRDALSADDRSFATSDLRSFGGEDLNNGFANPGTIVTDGTFGIPTDQDGTSLSPGDFIIGLRNTGNEFEGADLSPDEERYSAFVAFDQDIGDSIRFYGDFLFSHREFESRGGAFQSTLTVPSSNPFFVDPAGGNTSVRVAYSFIDDYGPQLRFGDTDSYNLTSGLEVKLFKDWQLDLFGTYSFVDNERRAEKRPNTTLLRAALADSDPATAFNPFGDGSFTNPATLAAIEGFSETDREGDVWSINAIADGSLFSLPGGNVKAAIGASYREEGYSNFITSFTSGTSPRTAADQDLSRDVSAIFGEVIVPIIGEDNSLPGVQRFEVTAAVRYEDYSDFGSTTNPKVGAIWQVADIVRLRGTYGTSFRAPLLTQLDDSNAFTIFSPIPDPIGTGPGGTSNALILIGNNSALEPEEARTYTIGADFNLDRIIPGLRANVTYFDIKYENRIANISSPFTALLNENLLGPVIDRMPGLDSINEAFGASDIVNNVGSTDPANVDVLIDGRQKNLSVLEVAGFDFGADFSTELGDGQLTVRAGGSIYTDFTTAFTTTQTPTDVLGTIGNPVDYRLRNSIGYSADNWSLTLFHNHVADYLDNLSDPERRVDSWNTFDVRASYRLPDVNSIIRGVSVSVFALNVLSEDPPFVNNIGGDIGFDPEQANARGQFIGIEISKDW